MSDPKTEETATSSPASHPRKRILCLAGMLLLIALAIVRTAVTTSLDSFTYDEGYHIGAGAVHIRTGDFRLNPEQPPLTKLWVGA